MINMEKELERLEEGPKAKRSKKYQIGKRQAMMAYMCNILTLTKLSK